MSSGERHLDDCGRLAWAQAGSYARCAHVRRRSLPGAGRTAEEAPPRSDASFLFVLPHSRARTTPWRQLNDHHSSPRAGVFGAVPSTMTLADMRALQKDPSIDPLDKPAAVVAVSLKASVVGYVRLQVMPQPLTPAVGSSSGGRLSDLTFLRGCSASGPARSSSCSAGCVRAHVRLPPHLDRNRRRTDLRRERTARHSLRPHCRDERREGCTHRRSRSVPIRLPWDVPEHPRTDGGPGHLLQHALRRHRQHQARSCRPLHPVHPAAAHHDRHARSHDQYRG